MSVQPHDVPPDVSNDTTAMIRLPAVLPLENDAAIDVLDVFEAVDADCRYATAPIATRGATHGPVMAAIRIHNIRRRPQAGANEFVNWDLPVTGQHETLADP